MAGQSQGAASRGSRGWSGAPVCPNSLPPVRLGTWEGSAQLSTFCCWWKPARGTELRSGCHTCGHGKGAPDSTQDLRHMDRHRKFRMLQASIGKDWDVSDTTKVTLGMPQGHSPFCLWARVPFPELWAWFYRDTPDCCSISLLPFLTLLHAGDILSISWSLCSTGRWKWAFL